jgi:hypothetical protein
MASKREEKERLRAQRLAAQQASAGAARRRLIAGYVVAGILTLAVLAGLVAVISSGGDGEGGTGGGDTPSNAHIQVESGTVPEDIEPDDREGVAPPEIKIGDLEEAAKAAGCELQLDLPDEGNTHLEPGEPTPKYKSNPPTSGNHITPPLQTADGAYLGEVPSINFVHALEHGRIAILYKPDLPEDQQLALKGVFDDDPDGMLLFPNSAMPYQVAAAAWTNYVGCPTYSPEVLDVIRDFRDTYRGNGPEPVPISL